MLSYMKKVLNIEFENAVFWYMTEDLSIPELAQEDQDDCIIYSVSKFGEMNKDYIEYQHEQSRSRRYRQELRERDIKRDTTINIDIIKKIEDSTFE